MLGEFEDPADIQHDADLEWERVHRHADEAVDIVEQLRMCGDGISNQAADEIEKLRGQLKLIRLLIKMKRDEAQSEH